MKTSYLILLVLIFTISVIALLTFIHIYYIFLPIALASLSIISVGYLNPFPTDSAIDIERNKKEVQTREGSSFEVKLTITNKSDSKLFLEIQDKIPKNTKLIKGSNHHFLHLVGEEKKEIKYKIKFLKTESYKVGPIKIRYISPMRLFSKEWKFDKFLNVVALPPVEDLGSTKLRPQITKGWLGNIRSQQMGIGSEFYSIREYHQGDQMRDLNWKAMARYLDPKTNAYKAEKSGDVIIIVDAFKESNVGVFEENILKHSIKATTSLTSDLISDRNRVGLIVMGEFVRWVYPKAGQEQIYEITDNLMDLKSGSFWRVEHAKYILEKIFPNECMLIFISPLINEKVTETIADLARKRYEMAVVSPCPIELQKKYIDKKDKRVEQLHKIERENRMTRLRDYGPVIDWDTSDPLKIAIEKVIRYQRKA